MPYDDLLSILQKKSAFTDREEAQDALIATLDVLGYILPHPLVNELAAALPRSCSSFLQRGRSASDGARRGAHGAAACMPNELAADELERINLVCGALFGLLPLDLVRTIDRALPRPLTGVFERYGVRATTPNTLN
jgi:hypothetical protein